MTKARLAELAQQLRALEALTVVLEIANQMVARKEAENLPTAFATIMMELVKAEPQMHAIARSLAEAAKEGE